MPLKILNNILLSELVELGLGATASRVSCPSGIAAQLSLVDHDEQFCHIELPGPDNLYERPQLWRIQDWRLSSTRDKFKREQNHLDRHCHILASELKAKLLRNVLGQMADSDAAVCVALTESLIKNRSSIGCQLFGIDIAELTQADKEAREHRNKK